MFYFYWSNAAVPSLLMFAYPAEKIELQEAFNGILCIPIKNLRVNLKLMKLSRSPDIYYVPLGVRIPQVGNRWSNHLHEQNQNKIK